MYAMVASATYQHHGFFTPLYHIASTFIAPTQLMTSMQHAMMGSTFYFAGPAVLGAAIHMMTGAMYGVVFALAVPQAAPARRRAARSRCRVGGDRVRGEFLDRPATGGKGVQQR